MPSADSMLVEESMGEIEKKGKMSLLLFRSTLAHQTVKRRGTNWGETQGGGTRGETMK